MNTKEMLEMLQEILSNIKGLQDEQMRYNKALKDGQIRIEEKLDELKIRIKTLGEEE